MSDFLSLEESAEQLGVSDGQLRSWIKRGMARATRRGGEYTLRPEEVERLRQDPPSGDSPEEASPAQRPRVLPPRSEKNPDSFAGERDRRRRMGRRASDFTLEILHQEIKSAISAALEPILPRLQVEKPAPASDNYEIEALEGRIIELEGQIRHQDLAREEFRQRLEESERHRHQLEASARGAENAASLRVAELEGQLRQAQQAQHHDEGTQQLLQRLSREVTLERQLRQEALDNAERLRAEIDQLQSSSLAMDAERARWSLENRSLQGEIDRLTSMQESSQQRLQLLEKSGGDNEQVVREKDDEIRRLREQITSLTYKLQMAGTGATGTSPEESRRLMERLAEAQAEMTEKNELVNQTYAEIGELRSRLEAEKRSHYELLQRHNRLEEEWAQQAAQFAASKMNEHQQQQAPPPPGPGERPKGWGSLFGRRD